MGTAVKKIAKRLLYRVGGLLTAPLREDLARESMRADKMESSLWQMLQLQLLRSYRDQARVGRMQDFDDVGFNVFSQTNEDGILLYIFSLIGMTNRRCVDIGAAGVANSNVANLIINHGFSALLVDGNAAAVETARKYYQGHTATSLFPPTFASAFVTAENVNSILRDNSFISGIDLLCIDVDGNDYWIWKAIDAIDPRVVVVEYQDILGPDRTLTIPYKADFTRGAYQVNRVDLNYGGASLRAFVELGRKKGYRLVGCNRGGWNAFFVGDSIDPDVLPAVSVESCFRYDWNSYGMKERFELVKHMDWEEV
jgi:hypothetical protein